MTPHIQSWRTGRTWSQYHLFPTPRAPAALCGTLIPSPASLCALSDASAGLMLEQLCTRCLMAYALHQEGAPLKEPA